MLAGSSEADGEIKEEREGSNAWTESTRIQSELEEDTAREENLVRGRES